MSILQQQLKKLRFSEKNTGQGRRQASFLYSKEDAASMDTTTVSNAMRDTAISPIFPSCSALLHPGNVLLLAISRAW